MCVFWCNVKNLFSTFFYTEIVLENKVVFCSIIYNSWIQFIELYVKIMRAGRVLKASQLKLIFVNVIPLFILFNNENGFLVVLVA